MEENSDPNKFSDTRRGVFEPHASQMHVTPAFLWIVFSAEENLEIGSNDISRVHRVALCVTHPSPPFVLGERKRIFICIDLMRPVTRRFSGAQASSSDFSPYLFKKERLVSSLIKIWILMRVYCFIEGWIGVRSFDRGNWGFVIYSFYRQLAGYIVSISIMEWSCTCRMVNLFDLE